MWFPFTGVALMLRPISTRTVRMYFVRTSLTGRPPQKSVADVLSVSQSRTNGGGAIDAAAFLSSQRMAVLAERASRSEHDCTQQRPLLPSW